MGGEAFQNIRTPNRSCNSHESGLVSVGSGVYSGWREGAFKKKEKKKKKKKEASSDVRRESRLSENPAEVRSCREREAWRIINEEEDVRGGETAGVRGSGERAVPRRRPAAAGSLRPPLEPNKGCLEHLV